MGQSGDFENYSAESLKIGIVVARFNQEYTEKLLSGALDAFLSAGGNEDNLKTIWVPGAFELPLAAQTLAQTDQFDAIVCLGAVIRGDTPHFDYVCQQTAVGILHVGLQEEIPVIFGVITTDNTSQADDRVGGKHGNKGKEALLTAIEMCHVLEHCRNI